MRNILNTLGFAMAITPILIFPMACFEAWILDGYELGYLFMSLLFNNDMGQQLIHLGYCFVAISLMCIPRTYTPTTRR